jgi:predicted enzyme related to lactoylglutathione lyase
MVTQIAYITVLVRDQDEALRFYTEKLGMEKREEDTSIPDSRWLTVAPKNQKEVAFTLRKADGAELERVGNQTGRQFLCILDTDDCRKAYETLRSRGVTFLNPPKELPFGVVATFEDLYGNVFDLWEPRQA